MIQLKQMQLAGREKIKRRLKKIKGDEKMKRTKFAAILALMVCTAMLFSGFSVFALNVGTVYNGSGNLEISDPTYFA